MLGRRKKKVVKALVKSKPKKLSDVHQKEYDAYIEKLKVKAKKEMGITIRNIVWEVR